MKGLFQLVIFSSFFSLSLLVFFFLLPAVLLEVHASRSLLYANNKLASGSSALRSPTNSAEAIWLRGRKMFSHRGPLGCFAERRQVERRRPTAEKTVHCQSHGVTVN